MKNQFRARAFVFASIAIFVAALATTFLETPIAHGGEQTGQTTHSYGGTINGTITFGTGLGAVTQINGPSDQPLAITAGAGRALSLYPAASQNINLTTSGTGLIVPGTDFQAAQALTAGTATFTNSALIRKSVSRFDWTNAMVVALGGTGTGNVAVCTLPAKTAVTSAWIVIDSPDTSSNALTVSLGRTGAAYTDYVSANDAKAAANTIYTMTAALTDLPSVTGTAVVNAQFVKSITNLSTVTGSTGHIYLETITLP